MKTILSIMFIAIQAFAITEYINGSGYSSGQCRGDGFVNMCFDQLKDRAENDAQRDADMRCRLRQGTLQPFGGYCNTFCNPSFIPNGSTAFVNCNASCRFGCEIR